MQPPKSSFCVICGVRPATTVDHVPPKCFFKGIEGSQLRTVPACEDCNNGSSSDDEDVRLYISAQVGMQSAASKKLWESGAHKSILRKTRLRKSTLETMREVVVVDQDGTYTRKIGFLAPVGTYKRVFERTTRGLYFFHTETVLPAAMLVSVSLLAGIPALQTEDIQKLTQQVVGGGAFVYYFGVSREDPNLSLWIYEFHCAHWVMVTTGSLE
jgi:hypothetical protein